MASIQVIHPTSYSFTPTVFATNVSGAIQTAYNQGRIPPSVPIPHLLASQDAGSLGFIYFFLVFATLLVLLRLFSRSFLAHFFGPDDFLAALTIPIYVAFGALCIMLINIGSGKHIEYIQYVMTQSTNSLSERLDFYAHLLYTTALYVCRLSGLAFYRRLCRQIPRMNTAIWLTIALVSAGFVMQFLLIVLHCLPVTDLWPYVWQPEVENYTCILWQAIYTTNSAISLASDLLVFTIPAWVIYSLKGSQSSVRIKLIFILCPGILTTLVSITRLIFVIKSGWATDQSWLYSPLLAIEVIELGTTMIALSAPGINIFFHRISGKGAQISTSETHDSDNSIPMYSYSRETKVRIDRIGRERLKGTSFHHVGGVGGQAGEMTLATPRAAAGEQEEEGRISHNAFITTTHPTMTACGRKNPGDITDPTIERTTYSPQHRQGSEKFIVDDDDDKVVPYVYNATRR